MSDQDQPIEPAAEAFVTDAVAYEVFVNLAYRAVFDRIPSPGEVEEQVTALAGGVSRNDFLASFLASAEKQALDEARRAQRERIECLDAQAVEFIPMAYRAVFERDVDEGGRQISLAFFAGGGTFSDFLGGLLASEEAKQRHGNPDGRVRRLLYSAMDPERFVRLAFEAVLGRPADDGSVTFFVAQLEERMTPGDFLTALAGSPEGQNVRRQQGMAPALALCGSLTSMLEGMLRKRGVVLNLGPVPTFEASATDTESRLWHLKSTIEMLLDRDRDILTDSSLVRMI